MLKLLKKNTCFIILFFFLGFFRPYWAQEELNFTEVDLKTYNLYMETKWPELIKLGNKALKLEIDYFYLRMRMGIAYYETKNYRLAEGHFAKALNFDSQSELALEYLYYCYLFTGRNDEARKLSRSFSAALAEKTKTANQSPVGFAMLEAGTKISDSATYYDKNLKKSSNYFDPAVYVQAGINHYIKNRISFFHAFTYFSQQAYSGKVGQLQYYLKSGIPLKNNWSVSPAFHFVNINFTTEVPGQPGPPPPPGAPPPPPPQSVVSSTVSNYFVGSLAIQKDIKKLTLSLSNTYSNLYNETQVLHGLTAYCSVFGNSKLIFGATSYLHTNDSYSTINTSFVPFIFTLPNKHFSVKASYLHNQGNNIIEENAYIINNSVDFTRSRFSIIGNLYLTKQITIYTLYQMEFKTESSQQFDYRYNVLLGGIKITP